ncbi:OmpA family protein [Blattabacterium cuenoti]|uniref:OmpA family protein n=1 Tax=Blattabacterium cuenoti TaxID=1653831 RepID=UPI00163BC16B|nr:OmpA family protein [Blattabacterium cuenoti]
MKNVNFVILFFSLFSFPFSLLLSQSETKDILYKWSIQSGAYDVNFHPINFPLKNFLYKRNNNISNPFSTIELIYKVNKNMGVFFHSSLGKVQDPKWKIKNALFFKFNPGINFYLFSIDWLDPYFKLGTGYHHLEYKKRKNILRIGRSNYYQLARKGFLMLDGGLGMNIWMIPNFGINLQSLYNHVFSRLSKGYLNYWEHNLGLIYRFGEEKNEDISQYKEVKVIKIDEKNYFLPSEKKGIERIEKKGIEKKGKTEDKIYDPKKDLDKDGILDKDDFCPNEFGLKLFKGCPDTDFDNIPDYKDVCPDIYGKKEYHGCPNSVIFRPILFDKGKHSLSPISLEILNEIYEIMIKKLQNYNFDINGYTDSYRNDLFNQILSKKRAYSVFKVLVSKGVNPSRLNMKGIVTKKGRSVKITICK